MPNQDPNEIGVPTLRSEDQQFRPQPFDFATAADDATRFANLELKLGEVLDFLNRMDFRYGERFVGEMLTGLRLFGLTFGTQQPQNTEGEVGDVFLDYTQESQGDVVRPVVQTGNGYEDDVTMIEAVLQPLLNRIQSLEASQLDGENLQNELTLINAEFVTLNQEIADRLRNSDFTVANLFSGGSFTLSELGISDALTSTQIATEILNASNAIRGGAPNDADTLAKLNQLIISERARISALETNKADASQVATDIQAASDNVLNTIRAGVPANADDLSKLLALLVTERSRIDAILGGADAARDTFAEISALLDAENAEDAATVSALMTSIGEKLEASQSALIDLINMPTGDKAAIRAALETVSVAELSAAVAGLQTSIDAKANSADVSAALDAKQDNLTGTQGQRVGFDADGNPIAEDAPISEAQLELGGYSPINFEAVVSDSRAFNAYTLLKTGAAGANNVTQSFVEHELEQAVYTLHVQNASDEAAYLIKYQKAVGQTLTPDRISAGSEIVGHQGLGIEYRADGSIGFWSSANDSLPDPENHAVRFQAIDDPGNSDGLIIQNTEIYKLFPGNLGLGNTTPTVSWDGSMLIAEQAGDTTGTVRVFDLAGLIEGGPGDYSDRNDLFTEFDVSEVFSPTRRLQDLECDGQYIYMLASASSSIDARIAKYTLGGTLVSMFDVRAGISLAATDGSGTHYEPESLAKIIVDGQERLGLLVASGDTGARVNRVFYLDWSGNAQDFIEYLNVESLIASSETSRGAGSIWRAENYLYLEVDAGSAATDITTAAGVELSFQPKRKEFPLRAFGALGNDVSDTVIAQSVFDRANETSGATVIFEPGVTYRFDAQLSYGGDLTIKAKGAHIVREHSGNMLSNSLGVTSATIGYSGNGDIKIDGGVWDGNGVAFYDAFNHFEIGHCENVIIQHAEFRDGVRAHAIDISASRNVTIRDCHFLGYAHVRSTSTDTLGDDRTFSEAVQLDQNTSISFSFGARDGTQCENIKFERNTVGARDENIDPRFGSYQVGIGGHGAIHDLFPSNIIITKNTFYDCQFAAIRPYKWRDAIISKNTMTNCNRGVHCSGVGVGDVGAQDVNGVASGMPQAGSSVRILGNNMTGCVEEAVAFFTPLPNGTTEIAFWDDCIVSDNTATGATGNGQPAVTARNMRNSKVSGNIFRGFFRGAEMSYCQSTDIIDNSLEGIEREGIFAFEFGAADQGGEYAGYVAQGLMQSIFIGRNTIKDAGFSGINISTDVTGDGLQIKGNKVTGAASNGSPRSAITVNNGRNNTDASVVISDNLVEGNGGAADIGIEVTSSWRNIEMGINHVRNVTGEKTIPAMPVIGGRWVSSWVTIDSATAPLTGTDFTHGLGGLVEATVYFRESGTTFPVFNWSASSPVASIGSTTRYDGGIFQKDENTVSISVGNDGVFSTDNSIGGATSNFTAGEFLVIAELVSGTPA